MSFERVENEVSMHSKPAPLPAARVTTHWQISTNDWRVWRSHLHTHTHTHTHARTRTRTRTHTHTHAQLSIYCWGGV